MPILSPLAGVVVAGVEVVAAGVVVVVVVVVVDLLVTFVGAALLAGASDPPQAANKSAQDKASVTETKILLLIRISPLGIRGNGKARQ